MLCLFIAFSGHIWHLLLLVPRLLIGASVVVVVVVVAVVAVVAVVVVVVVVVIELLVL